MRSAWLVLAAVLMVSGCDVPLLGFGLQLRVIPSESMSPTLLVGDRIAVRMKSYSPEAMPSRGDVLVFQHPHNDRVMVSRVVGLPGDTVQLMAGQLFLNGEEVTKSTTRTLTYLSDYNQGIRATEYSEQLPGAARPHLIFEFSDERDLDETPLFKVPPGHVFMMGDNRDNAEDSRSPTGHPDMATQVPEAWPLRSLKVAFNPEDAAIGFVPAELLMGRATQVAYTEYACEMGEVMKRQGIECLKPKVGEPL
jgi:signal peptidase I